ncbi:hypothetical protein FGG08_002647 [Glutinoglossum americanum]|uniref:Voltage-gated hydrogen channel 1 n=1 Tax=Glutinoglossum americanum TaxID=1670608 RepID=A0A9P8I8X2_9PEZI|nr:hypothetical protein FGG08_002647 [Glutinoglossum americanum]
MRGIANPRLMSSCVDGPDPGRYMAYHNDYASRYLAKPGKEAFYDKTEYQDTPDTGRGNCAADEPTANTPRSDRAAAKLTHDEWVTRECLFRDRLRAAEELYDATPADAVYTARDKNNVNILSIFPNGIRGLGLRRDAVKSRYARRYRFETLKSLGPLTFAISHLLQTADRKTQDEYAEACARLSLEAKITATQNEKVGLFPLHAILANGLAEEQVDSGDRTGRWAWMGVSGEFSGGDPCLSQFGIRVHMPTGSIVGIQEVSSGTSCRCGRDSGILWLTPNRVHALRLAVGRLGRSKEAAGGRLWVHITVGEIREAYTRTPKRELTNTDTMSNDARPLLHECRQELARPSTCGESRIQRARQAARRLLSSRVAHYLILAMVALDVSCIFGDIFISLFTCGQENPDGAWDVAREALSDTSLVFSCLFMLELLVSVWALGFEYFRSWFRLFDATVITVGLMIDVLLHGVVVEVASLVIILRLWRIFKIVEEFSVGAEEEMSALTQRVEQLENENRELKGRLGALRGEDWVGQGGR